MDESTFRKLIDKHLAGASTPEEADLLERYVEQFGNPEDHGFTSDLEKHRIRQALQTRLFPRRRSMRWVYAAASVVLLLGLLAWFGRSVTWLADPEANQIVVTGPGEHRTVRLPDGSRVELNGGSSLYYAQEFAGDTRAVFLRGEAYFEVVKDANRPFIVQHTDGQTEVLGTHFNVHAYPDEAVVVSLVEGSVRVAAGDTSVVLQPGQEAVWEAQGLVLDTLDHGAALAWRSRKLVFARTRFADVSTRLERQYGVALHFAQPYLAGYEVTGSIDSTSAENVVAVLAALKGLEYRFIDENVALLSEPDSLLTP